jgi:hypothetical protein
MNSILPDSGLNECERCGEQTSSKLVGDETVEVCEDCDNY